MIKLTTLRQQLPILGIGTAFFSDINYTQFVKDAIDSGYILFDTANRYLNEKRLGQAFSSLKIKREKYMIITKIWPTSFTKKKMKEAIEGTLKRLKTDYIDVILLHKPFKNYVLAYKVLEDYYRKGIVKCIGVSNFKKKHLQKIIEKCEISPMINQIEVNPYYYDKEAISFCQKMGIVVMGYTPLGDKKMLQDKRLIALKDKYNVSLPQLLLRHNYQLGVVSIVKTKSLNHMLENLNIQNFEISKEDMAAFKKMHKKDYRFLLKITRAIEAYIPFHPDKEKA